MEVRVNTEAVIDLQRIIANLSFKQQITLIKENINRATDDVLIQELVNRGYEISKG